MKKLHNKVNIVPLIAKSDVLTTKEVKRLKEKVSILNIQIGPWIGKSNVFTPFEVKKLNEKVSILIKVNATSLREKSDIITPEEVKRLE
jgi:septin family protein